MDYEDLYPKVKLELKNLLSHDPNKELGDILIQAGTGGPDEIDEAEKILRNKKVKKKLCAALESYSDDIWQMSKIVATSMVTLHAAGIVVASANFPTVVAIVIFQIGIRMGIKVYCAEFDE